MIKIVIPVKSIFKTDESAFVYMYCKRVRSLFPTNYQHASSNEFLKGYEQFKVKLYIFVKINSYAAELEVVRRFIPSIDKTQADVEDVCQS